MTIMLLKLSFFFVVNPCQHYSNLSEANRNSKEETPTSGTTFCDIPLAEGWYRFVGAAGTKMPTTRVPAYRCGTNWSGWLQGAHPTVEDGEVQRMVCFNDRAESCTYFRKISVKNCGSYFIYKLYDTPGCSSRYCGTD